jgi:uncharacterized Zn-finger protein
MANSSADTALDTTNVRPPELSTEVKTVNLKDLPLSCPLPEDEVWNMHPRVYLPIEDEPSGEAICPYCGAHYRLQR